MELLSYLRSKSSILNWMFYNRTENSRILILCSAYHYAVGWLLVVFCVKMGATGSVVVNLRGFFHSSCLNDASSGENLKNKTECRNVKNVRILWSNFISEIIVKLNKYDIESCNHNHMKCHGAYTRTFGLIHHVCVFLLFE